MDKAELMNQILDEMMADETVKEPTLQELKAELDEVLDIVSDNWKRS